MSADQSPGPGVDATGQPVKDPTENVKELQEASIRRIDDIAELRSTHAEGMAKLREEHARELRRVETERINAILSSNDDKVQRAAEVQATQALTLATQVTTSAEALRASQTAAAIASDTKLLTALEPIQKRIDDLSRSQYEAAGQKTQVVETQAKSGNSTAMIAVAVAVVGLLVTLLLGVVGVVITLLLQGK